MVLQCRALINGLLKGSSSTRRSNSLSAADNTIGNAPRLLETVRERINDGGGGLGAAILTTVIKRSDTTTSIFRGGQSRCRAGKDIKRNNFDALCMLHINGRPLSLSGRSIVCAVHVAAEGAEEGKWATLCHQQQILERFVRQRLGIIGI